MKLVKHILLLFFATRAVLAIVGVLSRIIFSSIFVNHYEFPYFRHIWLDIWSSWDSGWYLDIATRGYSLIPPVLPTVCCGQTNYGFFPLYPMLTRALGALAGDYYIAGILLSNVFLIIASVFLYKLVKLNSDKTTARVAVRYLFLFPTAFILSGVFAESLFLALILICFYYAKKRDWFRLGIYGFFLSLTKSLGLIMILPFFYEYLKSKNFKLGKVKLDSLYFLLIPLGAATFMAYTYFSTGDFLAYAHIKQSAWGVELSNPVLILIRSFLAKDAILAFVGSYTIVGALFLSFYYKKINVSYRIAAALLIAIPLMSGGASFISMPRHFLAVFPFYILFAKLSKNSNFDKIASVFLASFQVVLMVFWSNGLLIV